MINFFYYALLLKWVELGEFIYRKVQFDVKKLIFTGMYEYSYNKKTGKPRPSPNEYHWGRACSLSSKDMYKWLGLADGGERQHFRDYPCVFICTKVFYLDVEYSNDSTPLSNDDEQ